MKFNPIWILSGLIAFLGVGFHAFANTERVLLEQAIVYAPVSGDPVQNLRNRLSAFIAYSKLDPTRAEQDQKQAMRIFLSAFSVVEKPAVVLQQLNQVSGLQDPAILRLKSILQDPFAIEIAHAETAARIGVSEDSQYRFKIENGETLDRTSLALRNIELNKNSGKVSVVLQVHAPWHGEGAKKETIVALVQDAKLQFARGKATVAAILGDGSHYVALLMTKSGDVRIVDSFGGVANSNSRWEILGSDLRQALQSELKISAPPVQSPTYIKIGVQQDVVNCGLYAQQFIRQFIGQEVFAEDLSFQQRLDLASSGLKEEIDHLGGPKPYFGSLRSDLIEQAKHLFDADELAQLSAPGRPLAREMLRAVPAVVTHELKRRPAPPAPPIAVCVPSLVSQPGAPRVTETLEDWKMVEERMMGLLAERPVRRLAPLPPKETRPVLQPPRRPAPPVPL